MYIRYRERKRWLFVDRCKGVSGELVKGYLLIKTIMSLVEKECGKRFDLIDPALPIVDRLYVWMVVAGRL
jgi:hypothetical protein